MESVEAISGEWNSLSEMYFNQEVDFAAQLFDNCSLPNELSLGSCFDLPSLLPDPDFITSDVRFDNNTMYSLENVNNNQFLSTNNSSNLMDYYYTRMGESQPETVIRESKILAPEESQEDKPNHPSERSKKRPRNPSHVQRKNRRILSSDEDYNAALHKQSSSNFCSEDEYEGTKELNTVNSTSKSKESVALNSNRKTRASRGSATDPQSIYARKRRERINERLRVLQNLVPNGTKVDISTMLEEAVQYVKFLQLQIKLLSSDDLWMYAPIAYNGMEIGLDLKITSPR